MSMDVGPDPAFAASPSSHSSVSSPESGVGLLDRLNELIHECENIRGPSHDLNVAISKIFFPLNNGFTLVKAVTTTVDDALLLLKPGNDWRRLTPTSMSVYAASPYNAKAQVRYDGYGATPALQLCAAAIKMRAALEAKALAAATGTAKTPKAVECEASQSGPKGNARKDIP